MFWPKQFPGCASLWLLLLCLLQRKYDTTTTTTRALLEINFKCIPKYATLFVQDRFDDDKLSKTTAKPQPLDRVQSPH